jgi:hypothetical protein
MSFKRIAAAAILALFPFAAHATVPPVPDTDRYASFALSSPTTVVGVPFAVYGDCTDIQVLYNGAALGYGSAWTCASASGVALNLQALPITDMQVTLLSPRSSGTLEIAGLWHPRNTSMSSAPGITRQEFNGTVNTLISSLREVKRFTVDFPETVGYILTSQGPGLPPVWGRAPTAGAVANFTGDTGSGGLNGLVPPPGAGQGAAGYLLSASGSWVSPTLGGSITNLSGSAQTTTATCTAGNATVTLALAKDFINGQGIALEHCGATFSGATPSAITVIPSAENAQHGPGGSTTYSYAVSCLDDNGGVGAYGFTTTTAGASTLGQVTQGAPGPGLVSYNHVSWTTACPAAAVWRNTASAGYHLVAVMTNGKFYDTGAPQIVVPWIPDTPPSSALNDRLVTTINSGAGTASLVLASAPGNSATGTYARHDDTTALMAYFNSATAPVIPAGTFNAESLALPSTVKSLTGAGAGATFIQGWSAASTSLYANGQPNGFRMANLSVKSISNGATAVTLSALSNCEVYGLALSGNTPLAMNSLSYCDIHDNHFATWYSFIINSSASIYSKIHSNNADIGLQPAFPSYGILDYNGYHDEIYSNHLLGGTFFGIGFAATSNSSAYDNVVLNSEREALHVSGSASSNIFRANHVNGGSSSIDFCVSLSDDTQPSVTQNSNVVSNNYLVNCGTSAIAVLQFGGTSPVLNGTIIIGNIIINSNMDGVASTPDIVLGGVAVTNTVVHSNTFQSGPSRVNYNVAEQNYYGVPSYTQVGSNFGALGGAGTASLSGTGSIKLISGGSGL